MTDGDPQGRSELHDFMSNLGYFSKGTGKISLTFIKPGKYSFDSIKVYAVPYKSFDGQAKELSDNRFKMYDSKYFKKLLEIKFNSLIISAIQLDNNDLIFACSDNGIFQILVYRLKEKQYFEIQKIIENELGFQARIGNH